MTNNGKADNIDDDVLRETVRSAVFTGWMTPNQARKQMGLEPVASPEYDRFYMPVGATGDMTPRQLQDLIKKMEQE